MAGSYNHIITATGAFRGGGLLDNKGDVYEALEECYGMIWFLAQGDKARVEEARQHYQDGLKLAPQTEEEEDEE